MCKVFHEILQKSSTSLLLKYSSKNVFTATLMIYFFGQRTYFNCIDLDYMNT